MTHMQEEPVASDYREQAAEWCFHLADRPLSRDEREAYEQWLLADPRHRAAFDEMVAVWQNTDAIAEMPGFLALRAKALNAMDDGRGGRRAGRARDFWQGTLAVAAVLALMIASSLWYLADRPDLYTTGVGERRTVHLADGSKISLDASSRVAVSYSDAARRIVLDQGRAKFDVARDSLRPFTVRAGERTVVATGTAFSVELLHDEMRVLLYEGRVEVIDSPSDTTTAVESGNAPLRNADRVDHLMPGQALVADLSSSATRVVAAEPERSLSWEAGRLDFVDEPLSSAVERVNRYTGTPIVLGDAAVGRYRVNGVFDAGDAGSFVTGVTSLFPISTRYGEDQVILTSYADTSSANDSHRK